MSNCVMTNFVCHIVSAASGPKSCAWTHHKDYMRLSTSLCVLRVNNSTSAGIKNLY